MSMFLSEKESLPLNYPGKGAFPLCLKGEAAIMIITIHTAGGTQAYTTSAPRVKLSQAMRECGLTGLNMPCGGRGVCGKCRVYADGNLSAPTPEELSLLSGEERAQGIRLACMAWATGDCSLRLPEHEARILTGNGSAASDWSPLDAPWGFAVDIGTTTVALELWDLQTRKRLGTAAFPNPQSAYGADVISRIQSALEGQADAIRQQILLELDRSMASLAQGLPPQGVAVITGNTTMLYLLTGTDPEPLSHAPFTLTEHFGGFFPALKFPSLPEMRCWIPQPIAAFVGSDITCSILGGAVRSGGVRLLADIGTNGEMALSRGGELWCCSTAAGPAFEGAGITMGSAAVDGALSRLDLLPEGGFSWSVIGRGDMAPADGICGSGLIDAAAACLSAGLVDETGRIEPESEWYTLYHEKPALRLGDSGVLLTQEDFRAVQLAKAAICAGIRSLLHEAEIPMENVEELVLAGGFGTYLRRESAARIGLIPAELAERARPAGNTALAGALLLLQSDTARQEGARIPGEAVTLELSTSPYFMDQYVEEMLFPYED